VQFEEVVPHEDGLHTYISVKFPLVDAGGQAYAVCGISTDITARKQAEQEREALLQRTTAAEAKFRGLVESAPDGILIFDQAGTIQLLNRHAEALFGYRAEELAGQSVEMLLPERLQEIHRAHRTNYMAAPRARPMGVGLELLGRRKDGSEFPLEVSLSPLEAEGAFLVMSIIRDVTERKRAEQALQTQARVMDSMVEGVVVADDSGRIVLTNPSMDAMFGYAPGELVGQHVTRLNRYSPEENQRMVATVVARVKAEGSWAGEFQNQRKDGTPFTCETRINALEISGQHYLVSVQQDVTDRKRLESQILTISEHEQARIGQDIHDGLCQHLLGTAVTVGILLQELADQALPEVEQVSRLADMVDIAITQARQIARGLYPVKLEAGGLKSALQELAASVSDSVLVDCRVTCAEDVPDTRGDTAIHLFRIAQEAVNNAAKHSGAEHIDITLTADDNRLCLRVADDGVGLPAERSDGMGLHIMEYRARMIGATLEIGRGPTGGTVVTCWIPKQGAEL